MYNRGGRDSGSGLGSGPGGKGFGYTGFSMNPHQQPSPHPHPPAAPAVPRKGISVETHLAQMGYGMPGGIGARGYGGSWLGKRRVKSEEEYFEDDEENAAEDLEYQPAPGSPSLENNEDGGGGGAGADKKKAVDSDSDGSVDPLDAFMEGIQDEVRTQQTKDAKKSKKGGVRDDIENEDDQESYFRYIEENPHIAADDEEEIEYDEEGNAIIPEHRRIIDPLPAIDHSEIDYNSFVKNFYYEHEEITQLSPQAVNDLRNRLGIRVSGILPQKPVSSFAHFGFDEALMKAIRKAKYTQPTPIQAQGIPVAMAGRDIIGIAKTGSGKTAAYLWPLLIHIMDQKELKAGDGPIGLILAPTRELSQQIYHETKKFGKIYNINVVCAYGGGSMWEQSKACEEGAEIIVATPGRLIDLVKKKATNLKRVTYVVFDEADRMFDMGFEPQVRSIANHVRPDRQTLLFSATFRRRVERLARDILNDPIRVIQGELGEANEDVTQIVRVMPPGPAKWKWLLSRLVEFTTVGSVLIFVTRKANSEELTSNLKANDFKVALLHGDMSQTERNTVITSFKKKEVPIMVATDVAARGLDIPAIRTVVNFDVARDIDTHTHRIGRTGRAGTKGTAFTLITPKDREFAGHLVRNLEGASQDVPPDLLDLAMQNPNFKKSRFKEMKAKRLNVSSGLGFRERPGLGSSSGTNTSSGGSAPPRTFSNYEPAQNVGPQSDRISAMKSAFMAQFKSSFVASAENPPPPPPPPADDPSSSSGGSRRKKSRWN